MSRKIKIAILDTGIDSEYAKHYLQGRIDKNYVLAECNNHINFEECEPNDENGHGTACVSTINRLCKKVEYTSIQLLNNKGESNICKLISSLIFLKNLDVDLINVSLSSNDERYADKINTLISELKEQHKYVIAAESNDRKVSIPAQLDGSFGVKSYISSCETDFCYRKNERIQLICDGTPCMLPNYGYIPFFGGNSKATAHMTGIVASYLSSTKEYVNFEDILIRNSTKLRDNDEQVISPKIEISKNEIKNFKITLNKTNIDVDTIFNKDKKFLPQKMSIYYDLLNFAENYFNLEIDPEDFCYADFLSLKSFLSKINKVYNEIKLKDKNKF